MTIYHLTLSLPTSDNRKSAAGLRKDGSARLYSTKQYKSRLAIIEAEAAAQGFRRKDNVEYSISMAVYLATKQADAPNIVKCLFDAVFGAVGDNAICEWHGKRYVDTKKPRVEMDIIEIEEEEPR